MDAIWTTLGGLIGSAGIGVIVREVRLLLKDRADKALERERLAMEWEAMQDDDKAMRLALIRHGRV
ncbi:hypothetical protein GCM10025867_46300 (plasmid) [Frondihabitans sucicola]|uniref:Uncharacterized protein n=1 Tax=Frondihabitans sucicola TaxID=1268041 RepID=A0ABM8GV86_9MICO|nr:hypothetical protein [Frondihabitans sucicola]BDZ52389.1 hypothetical protein GCM10025867_46300 [Frondihabitans sucicola]